MTGPIRFVTERLDVSPWETRLDDPEARPGFVAALAGLLTPDVTRHLPPVWQIASGSDDLDGWIAARRAESAIAAVHERQGGALSGLLVARPGASDDALTVGYLFGTRHWGRGYATELVRGLISWATCNGYSVLEAGVVSENAASAAVLTKTGFKRAGVTGDGVDAYRLEIPAARD
ncbi:MAG: GNAT family N-acetyltransferase [Phyllobacteriaceae bacterium]|nr:GNAT family N-acetyltransferase [Phyllobacteriaceae bacterium]